MDSKFYNYLNSFSSLDSISSEIKQYNIHTLEIYKKWKKIIFSLEAGLGNYSSPNYDLQLW